MRKTLVITFVLFLCFVTACGTPSAAPTIKAIVPVAEVIETTVPAEPANPIQQPELAIAEMGPVVLSEEHPRVQNTGPYTVDATEGGDKVVFYSTGTTGTVIIVPMGTIAFLATAEGDMNLTITTYVKTDRRILKEWVKQKYLHQAQVFFVAAPDLSHLAGWTTVIPKGWKIMYTPNRLLEKDDHTKDLVTVYTEENLRWAVINITCREKGWQVITLSKGIDPKVFCGDDAKIEAFAFRINPNNPNSTEDYLKLMERGMTWLMSSVPNENGGFSDQVVRDSFFNIPNYGKVICFTQNDLDPVLYWNVAYRELNCIE